MGRMLAKALVVLAATAVVLLALASSVGASGTEQRGLYIALGTSISAGDGASSVNKSFVRLYYGYLQSNGSGVTDLANVAISGVTSTQMRAIELPTALGLIDDASSDTKAVTLNIGMNDLRFDPKCETATAPTCPLAGNLRAILAALNTALAADAGDETVQVMDQYNPDIGAPLESDTRQLLLGSDGMVDCSAGAAALGVDDLSHCISIEQGAQPVDVLPIFDAAGPAYIASDHIHPSDAGHLAIAKAFGGAATPTAPPPPPPPVTHCKIPNVKGKTLAAAKQAISASHCRTGKVTRAFSFKIKTGRVISQKPGPGATLPAASKVDLVVSRGRKK